MIKFVKLDTWAKHVDTLPTSLDQSQVHSSLKQKFTNINFFSVGVLVYLFMTVLYLHYLFYFILGGGGSGIN